MFIWNLRVIMSVVNKIKQKQEFYSNTYLVKPEEFIILQWSLNFFQLYFYVPPQVLNRKRSFHNRISCASQTVRACRVNQRKLSHQCWETTCISYSKVFFPSDEMNDYSPKRPGYGHSGVIEVKKHSTFHQSIHMFFG